jgi:hypothetical protein
MKASYARLALAVGLLASTLGTQVVHAGGCETIRFQRGESSGSVHGVAPPDDVVCYQMTTGAGQTATLEIQGRNVMFSIDGVVDGQDRYSFTTEKKTYRVHVGQLMRAVQGEPFTLSVSIE